MTKIEIAENEVPQILQRKNTTLSVLQLQIEGLERLLEMQEQDLSKERI